ncbi:helix-turn-helix domain-containing protein [Gemmatimonadota bacterium]
MSQSFSEFILEKRLALLEAGDRQFSQRQVALRIGIQPAYLSQIERGNMAPPSEEKIVALANELGEDPDYLLSLAGKVASDLQFIIRERPVIYGRLIRTLGDESDETLYHIIDQAKEGYLPGRRTD